jgi:pSer/pThr/pTyr-binding forkhead associated (FHA) protein
MNGGVMADKATPPKDLTSTLNMRQLRAIPQAQVSDEVFKSLSDEQRNVLNNLPKGQGILFVLKGAGVGSRFLLDAAETKIGRDINNEIHLDDITVSRSHALITKNDGYRI